jgi:hypothetical protein
LKQQAHFRPGKLLETFGRNSLFSPIYLLWEKKRPMGRLKNKEK